MVEEQTSVFVHSALREIHIPAFKYDISKCQICYFHTFDLKMKCFGIPELKHLISVSWTKVKYFDLTQFDFSLSHLSKVSLFV